MPGVVECKVVFVCIVYLIPLFFLFSRPNIDAGLYD